MHDQWFMVPREMPQNHCDDNWKCALFSFSREFRLGALTN